MKKRTSICASILHTLRFTLRPAHCQQLASETGKKEKKRGAQHGTVRKMQYIRALPPEPPIILEFHFFFVPIAAKLSGLLPD